MNVPIEQASFGDLMAALATAKGAEKKAIQAELDRRAKMAAE